MYTYNDLVAALQSGVSAEDLAAQMSKDLNAAKAESDRLTAERAEAEKKAATEARKRLFMSDFYSALGAYVTEFYPDSVIAEMIVAEGTPSDESLDQFVEQMDTLIMTFDAMKGLAELLGDVKIGDSTQPQPKANLNNFVNETVEIDPLEVFLNKHVRKW